MGTEIEMPDNETSRILDQSIAWLRETLGPPLHALHEPLDVWLDSLPMWMAKASAVALFVFAGIWVVRLRREFVYLGAPDQARWRDLRIWAVFLLAIYASVYITLG